MFRSYKNQGLSHVKNLLMTKIILFIELIKCEPNRNDFRATRLEIGYIFYPTDQYNIF